MTWRGKKLHSGFTLTELMVTIVIGVVLAGISIPVYRLYILRARAIEGPNIVSQLLMLELEWWHKPHVDKATGLARPPCWITTWGDNDGGTSGYYPASNITVLQSAPLEWGTAAGIAAYGPIPPGFGRLGFRPGGSTVSYTLRISPGPILGGAAGYCSGASDWGGPLTGVEEVTVWARSDLDRDGVTQIITATLHQENFQVRKEPLRIYNDDY